MSPKRPPLTPDRDGLPSTDHMDRLVAAFERIADEIKAIRETFDRLYDDFDWAINNDKLMPERLPRFSALASDTREPLTRDPVERHAGIPGAVQRAEAPAPPATGHPASQGELFF